VPARPALAEVLCRRFFAIEAVRSPILLRETPLLSSGSRSLSEKLGFTFHFDSLLTTNAADRIALLICCHHLFSSVGFH
jgi:hypothetical protein